MSTDRDAVTPAAQAMTDLELLELAAKAAGIEVFDDKHGETWRVYYTDPNNGLKRYTRWSPLTDDGDALRLAVKLRIDFKNYSETVRTWVGDPVAQKVIASIEELCGGDPYATTRRAIVRAAAKIGRNMK